MRVPPQSARAWAIMTALMSIGWLASCGDDDGGPGGQTTDVADGSDLSRPDADMMDDEDTPGDVDLSEDPFIDPEAPDLSDTSDSADPSTDPTIDPDAAVDATDTDGGTPPVCGEVTFSYDAGSEVVTTAIVAGSFNGWGSTEEAGGWAMADTDGDHVWTVTRVLDPGTYQYKFVINGAWLTDPSNPDTTPDGYGGFNSVLDVSCDGVELVVVDHYCDDSGTIEATVHLTPASVVLNAASVEVTMDHQPVSSSDWSTSGNAIIIEMSGVEEGIHDVRVSASSTDGAAAPFILLKFHVGVSTDWRDDLIYFAMTDRFRNGDLTNDGDLGAIESRTDWYGGDFAGLIETLDEDYFDDLGVNVIWISWPIANYSGFHDGARPNEHRCDLNASSMATVTTNYTAYHGYWPSNLTAVDSHFGTLADLQELVDTAHAHGIRILLDFTANHVHTSSPFFTEHRDEFFNHPYNGSEHLCANVGWDTEPESCWFTEYLADLNYGNPAASNAVVDMAFYWIRETGADGFRVDAVKHINRDFLRVLRRRLSEEIELTGIPFYLVGETFTGDANLIASFIGDDMIHGQFDFPLNNAVLRAFAQRTLGLNTLDSNARMIKGTYGNGLMSNFLGNHDIARFLSMASGDIYCGVWDVTSNIAQGWLYPPSIPNDAEPGSEDGYRMLQLAFTYIMTIPGIPLIYYGDEFGMPGAGDPDNRRPMRFGGELTDWEPQTLAFMQRLGSVRAAHPSLRTGTWGTPLWAEADILAYPRSGGGETAIVVLNRGGTSRSLALSVSELGLSDGTALDDALSTSSSSASVSEGTLIVTIPGRSAAIYITR